MKRGFMWGAVGLLALVGVSGCINYEEDMTLNRNGSGKVTEHFWMASDLAKMMEAMSAGQAQVPKFTEDGIRKYYQGKPGITIENVKIEEKEGQKHVYVTLSFDKVQSLAEKGEQISFSEQGGQITFARTAEVPGGVMGMGGGAPAAPPGAGAPAAPPSPPSAKPKNPAEAQRHYQAGISLKKAKKSAQAAAELEQAVQDDPDHLDAHWALAWTYAELGRNQQGVTEFQEVVRLAPPGSAKAKEAQQAIGRLTAKGLQVPSGATPGGTSTLPGMPANLDKAMAQAMGSAMGGGLKFTVHFPGEVLSVEGPGAKKTDKTATWQFSLADTMTMATSGGMQMKATAKAGPRIPLIPIVIATGVVVVLLAVVTLLRRRK